MILVFRPKKKFSARTYVPTPHLRRCYSSADDGSLSAAQQLNLQIELKRLELEFQEKQNAAELHRAQVEAENRRQNDRNEMVKHLIVFVTGSAGMDRPYKAM